MTKELDRMWSGIEKFNCAGGATEEFDHAWCAAGATEKIGRVLSGIEKEQHGLRQLR